MAKQRFNFIPYVVPTESPLHVSGRKLSSVSFLQPTVDYVRLETLEERQAASRRTFVSGPLVEFATDYALANNVAAAPGEYLGSERSGVGTWLLDSMLHDSQIPAIDCDGNLYPFDVDTKNLGVAPFFSLDLTTLLESNPEIVQDLLGNCRVEGKKHIIQLGEWPQGKVALEEEDLLEELYNHGQLKPELKCTGRLFTANGQRRAEGNFLFRANPEFEYQGQRYVRAMAYNDALYVAYNDLSTVPSQTLPQWFKVEPLNWVIRNWQKLSPAINPNSRRGTTVLELASEEVIMGGIPFYPDWTHEYCALWQNSTVRAYLNASHSEDLDGSSHYKTPYQWDFGGRGFMNEALNEEREPTRRYVFSDLETEIAPFALAGCVGLEQVVLHENIATIGKYAFDEINLQWAYRTNGNSRLILSKTLPADKSLYTEAISLDKLRQVFPHFNYEMLVSNINLNFLSVFIDRLAKSKLKMPYPFLEELTMSGNFNQIAPDVNFRFLPGQMDVNQVLNKARVEEKVAFYKFAMGLGCLSNRKMLDEDFHETETYLAQKASALLSGLVRTGTLHIGDFERLFGVLSFDFKPHQKFVQFIGHMDKKTYPNLELLLHLEGELPHVTSKVMENFADALAGRKGGDTQNGTSANRQEWEQVFRNVYLKTCYDGVTQDTQEIATEYRKHNLSQSTFAQTVEQRRQAKFKGMPAHILGKPLAEPNIMERIETIRHQTEAELGDAKALIEDLYARQFSYEMLDKYDAKNGITGLYADCCCRIDGGTYGKAISDAAMTAFDVQHLIVNNMEGQMVAKGTMYINFDKSYAVINDFEIGEAYKAFEKGRTGYYLAETEPQIKAERRRDLIFEALLRGVHDIVAEFDRQHPDQPMKKVVVGNGFNRLKRQCEQFERATKLLTVPQSYEFIDAQYEQFVLYDRNGTVRNQTSTMDTILDQHIRGIN